MSRIGILRWAPLHETLNTTISNKTSRSLIEEMDKESIIHPDIFITVAIVGALAIHSTLQHSNKAVISGLFALFCLILSTLLAPVIGILLVIFACYRSIATLIISRACKRGTFAGLMDGTDAFWAVEDQTSHSIINVLATADFSFIVSAMNNNEEPLQTIRELIIDRLLCTPVPFPKLLCFRQQSKLGYFYWEKQSSINIDKHVRFMDIEEEENGTISERSLKGYLSSLVNSPLPENNKSTWEILVGRYPINSTSSDPFNSMESGGCSPETNNGSQYPILFRIHHTLGDGVALVNLLLDTLSDPYTRSNTPVPNSGNHLTVPETQRLTEDVPSFCLDMPQENFTMKKSSTYNFNDYYSNSYQQACPQKLSTVSKMAREACRKLFAFIEESKENNNSSYKRSIQDINIMINDRPSNEFLELMESSYLTPEKYSQFCITNKQISFEKFMKRNNKVVCRLINTINNFYNSIKDIVQHSSTIFLAPACIFNQAITKRKDVNALHGPILSGYKFVGFHCEQEDDTEHSLMSKIKRIRSKTGAHFSDIILTALSSSLESFFKQCHEVPCDLTVVIPARIVSSTVNSSTSFIKSKNLTTRVTKLNHGDTKKVLDNKFSVALLTLPIANNCSSSVALFSKLRQVRKQSDLLRNSPDYIINYWMLKIVATLFPVCILRPILASTQSSLVMSNMPGPEKIVKLAGHTLHDLVFWVPNKETTGVGVTILSYAGRLQLGIIVDRALIPCQQDAQLILNNMVNAIQEMDKISSPS